MKVSILIKLLFVCLSVCLSVYLLLIIFPIKQSIYASYPTVSISIPSVSNPNKDIPSVSNTNTNGDTLPVSLLEQGGAFAPLKF